ncbi:MAG: IclR family transcriptional regulator [Steroidobacteraceae bacterium]
MVGRRHGPQQGIQSIEVGGRLLRALADATRPMMLRDLASAAEMPAPQAHRYLVSFARMGLVERITESGQYDLGPFALQLGLGALARLEPVTLAAPVLALLREQISQTVALAVWANHGPTMVRWLSADTPVAATLRVGSVMPLTRSATGGAFLAFVPRSRTAPLVRQELKENARHGIGPTTEAALESVIERTCRLGAARTSDFIPGIAGISAPVFDHSGEMVLALTALGYSKPFEMQLEPLTTAVCRAAGQLSARLGFAGQRGGCATRPTAA